MVELNVVDLVAVVNLVGIQLPAWTAFVAALILYREHNMRT